MSVFLWDVLFMTIMFVFGRWYQFVVDRRRHRDKAAHLTRLNRQINRGALRPYSGSTEPQISVHPTPPPKD